jgi:Icc protein
MEGTPLPRQPVRRRRTKPLRLVQFTDPHLYGDPDGRLRGVTTLASLERCIAHARRHHFPLDAVLLTGDLVHDDGEGYDRLRKAFSGIRAPVHCLAGNHDVPAVMHAALAARPFDLSPLVRYRDWAIVMLDTVVPDEGHGWLSPESLSFLDEALSRHADAHVLVCLHHQPVATGSAWLDELMLRNGVELLRCIDRHDNVRAMLWGHVHQAWDGMRDGTMLMSTPSTCVQFRPASDQFALDTRPPGYRWLHLYPDGRIDTRVEWLPDGD